MRQTRQRCGLNLLLLAAGLALLPGCFGGTQNPSYFPYLFPTGDIIRTHAKPPGHGYFANFDPHAVRLEVRPLTSTNPVRAQKVFLATIYDENGVPRRKRRVEWILEGVGNIVEVDESGLLAGRGYKVDNKYAVSYTDYCEHRMTRGNVDPNDDFMIRPGQSWCVVSSAVEGDTHLTVYAPEIANWDAHRVVVTTHWVDAEWIMPSPVALHIGSEQPLTTQVFRHTDRQPLANYQIRYRLLDGPPAVFLPNRTPEAVAVSDLRGQATVALAQLAPQPGVNRIGVEVIRPPDPTSPGGVGLVIGHGETTVSWQGPAVALAVTGPPAAALGQDIPFTIAVSNTGQVEIQALTVQDMVPEGVQYVRSEPPAVVEGNRLVWTLGVLPPGQAHPLQAVFRSTRLGAVTNCASVATVEGLRDEKCATTQVTAPQLTVNLTGPERGVVNMSIAYSIVVTNPGSGPATNVLLSARFDPDLEHESHANPVELPLGVLAPGETRITQLTLTPRQAGPLVNRLSATGDGNLRASAEHVVTVQAAQMTLNKTGPAARFVDQTATWDIQVANAGDVPLANVVLREQLAPELVLASASEGGQVVDGQVVWNLGNLPPREQRTVQVTARCATLTRKAITRAIATADPGLQLEKEAPIEIRGLPAFTMELQDVGDPVEVGGRVTYRIAVTNTGSLPANQVVIAAEVPSQMAVSHAHGPTIPRLDGQHIEFPAVNGVQPRQTVTYTIEVAALQPGDVRFRVALRSETLSEPVIKEESTTIYLVPPGARTAPARPPGGLPPESPPPPLAPPGSGAAPKVT